METTRDIITIDEEKCTGCELCVPNCPEGALQIIDGKARLVSDLFCDGLGACIGHCPEGAITIETRPAEPYDEHRVMENIVKKGPATIRAHLDHLKSHGADEFFSQAVAYLEKQGIPVPDPAPANHLACGCPGSAVRELKPREEKTPPDTEPPKRVPGQSQLTHWPVQIMLVPPFAPFLKNADLLITADCVPFAYPEFHDRLLKGKTLLVGCPKLDDASFYQEKLAGIFSQNDIRSVTVAHMEVPCCTALTRLVRAAIEQSGKIIPFVDVTVGIQGDIKQTG
ncbi:ATP-binding protein [Candidatus Latescibacterota bacterium]